MNGLRFTAGKLASRNRSAQRGAALLAAMLIVTLVATFSAAALWRQWRSVEIESAERSRVQSAWVLVGALDWSRLILREDGRAGGADHLAEPWAVPLAEARLSSFLAADKNIASDAIEGLPDAFMSGGITDAQSKLNVRNLVVGNRKVDTAVEAFTRLFDLLGLPTQEVDVLANNLQRAGTGVAQTASASTGTSTSTTGTGNSNTSTAALVTAATNSTTGSTPGSATGTANSDPFSDGGAPLMPQTEAELVWLGLSPSTVAALEPYVTILPRSTALNINTASAEAMAASIPGLDLAGARRLVQQRSQRFFSTLDDARQALPGSNAKFTEGQQSVSTNYFEVIGRLRLDRIWVQEHSMLERQGTQVTIVWRHRGAGATNAGMRP
ncbi:type II secretion system minor pseudopilin GspK [Variovorax dokdonensis]|uniref:Type II secretion system minor pseudopilin GspK n=1 Tax=Variovorax dokdonensis TaxID=344883 RepID=A0ABT7NBP4_9BURK|nr:type II secretion system minor pseudopilin GspK [Variovorax dokdonensis]MDM0045337.1 type II secretion system minor pseudopilin GspK [Variovorax dokdonensis]